MTSSSVEANTRKLGDFAHVDTADAGNLVDRLDAMHALRSFQIYKQETFDLLRFKPGASVADVGCGTGEDAKAMAALVAPGGTATGFDLSAAMLEQARVRHAGTAGLDFVQAPADALGAADGTFDAIRADRVLIHVPNAAGALREMIRATKSGGRIVISEPDMPGCWVASSDYATTDLIMRHIAQSCIAPYLARDLMTMFRDAGLTDVGLNVRTVTAFDPVSVSKILDFNSVVMSMMAQKILSEDEVCAWTEDFAERGRTGRFAAGVNIMIVSGTKP